MINEKLIDLYKTHYGEQIKDIIPCGIVDEDTYTTTKIKIVYVLREAHMRTPYKIESGFTIPKGLKRNAEKGLKNIPMGKNYMYTWRQAGVWAYAILNGFDSYKILKRSEYVAKGLLSIGMTNHKKTGGGTSAKEHEIEYHAKRDKNLWQRELEIMNPDLVLCGGTYRHIADNLKLEKYFLHKDETKTYFYSVFNINGHRSVILDFWHPNNRRNRNKNLTVLKYLIDKLNEEGCLLPS